MTTTQESDRNTQVYVPFGTQFDNASWQNNNSMANPPHKGVSLETQLQLTPVAFVLFGAVLVRRHAGVKNTEKDRRAHRLLMLLLVVPLSVFVLFSLFRNIKLHWTAPVWLSARLPRVPRIGSEQFGTS